MSSYENKNHYEQSIAYMKGQVAERERIRNLLGEFGMKLEKEVSDGENYSLGRYDAISEFIAILDGELHE